MDYHDMKRLAIKHGGKLRNKLERGPGGTKAKFYDFHFPTREGLDGFRRDIKVHVEYSYDDHRGRKTARWMARVKKDDVLSLPHVRAGMDRALAELVTKAAVEVLSFKEDLAPQVILLMGLPAAGKTTFINERLKEFYNHRIPHASGFQVIASDKQVLKMQYLRGMRDFAVLSQIDHESEYNAVTEEMTYKDNDGAMVSFPLSFDEFQAIESGADFYRAAYKPYYATYFGERAKAKEVSDELGEKKLAAGDVVIIDATGTPPSRYLGQFAKAQERGMTTSVVFLEIDYKLCIRRDNYRKETEGRGVGESGIMHYVPLLPKALSVYKKDPRVDRLLHFRWRQAGDSPTKGVYKLVKEIKRYPKLGGTPPPAKIRPLPR